MSQLLVYLSRKILCLASLEILGKTFLRGRSVSLRKKQKQKKAYFPADIWLEPKSTVPLFFLVQQSPNASYKQNDSQCNCAHTVDDCFGGKGNTSCTKVRKLGRSAVRATSVKKNEREYLFSFYGSEGYSCV